MSSLSHRTRAAETRGMPPNAMTGSSLQQKKQSRPSPESYVTRLPQRTSITSVSSSGGRRSSSSLESNPKSSQPRPSALPRSTSSGSQSRLSFVSTTTRPTPASNSSKTSTAPAATSSESSRTVKRSETSRSLNPKDQYRSLGPRTQSPLDMSEESIVNNSPEKRLLRNPAPLPPRLIPELQALAASSHRNMLPTPPPPPPSSSLSSISSPSTQFTTSPSPWSVSTAATTPTSWSSASPCIIQQAANATSNKRSQTVPIPASQRTKLPKMPVLKESQSSLLSTAKTESKREASSQKRKLKKTPVNSPAPTPPPRSSSVKDSRSRSNSKSSIQERLETPTALPPIPPKSGGSPTSRPVRSHGQHDGADSLDLGHSRLQAALHGAMSQPQQGSIHHTGLEMRDQEKPIVLSHTQRPKHLMEAAPIVQSQHHRNGSHEMPQASAATPKPPQKQSARSRLAKFSKLALFGRSKEPVEAESTSNKIQRKGPVAGTGHEGYGRFGRKTRKPSVSSVGATESDTSVSSQSQVKKQHQRRGSNRRESSSQSDLDDFAATRMKPVVLVGGSSKGDSQNQQPIQPERQVMETRKNSAKRSSPVKIIQEPSETKMPSKHAEEPRRPTLALRRSQKFADAHEEFHLPNPIRTENLVAPTPIDSQNTMYSAEVPISAAYSEPTSDMHRVDPYNLEKQQRKPRKLNWNIFRRKDDTDPSPPLTQNENHREREMQVSISTVAGVRSMPYYAMLESEPEITTTEAIGLYLSEAAHSPKLQQDWSTDQSVEGWDSDHRKSDSILLPAPEERKLSVPEPVEQSQQTLNHKLSDLEFPLPPERPSTSDGVVSKGQPEEEVKPRQPRLAQVGRIPKVIRGAQPTALPKPELLIPKLSQLAQEKKKTPSSGNDRPETRSNTLHLAPRSDFRSGRTLSPVEETKSDVSPQESTTPSPEEVIIVQEDFLKFAEPRNSDFTTSSSSDGVISIMGPPPGPPPIRIRQSEYIPPEDDIWNEYDDFIDRVISPPALRKVETGFGGVTPREQHDQILGSRPGNGKTRGLALIPAPLSLSSNSGKHLLTPPLVFEPSPTLQQMPSSEEIRLRRSRIAAALHASYASFDPSSPFSMREFIAEYSQRDSAKMSGRFSNSTIDNRSPLANAFTDPAAEQQSNKQYENAAQIDDRERAKNPAKHSELSYASLMVSRWLSFGRVLVSPAHKEIETTPERHILVIDGLGNEDWSIYCAVTYQAEKAYVHDLKEKRSKRQKSHHSRNSEGAPANHRRAEVSSFDERFPFPPSFFAAIVVRFPPTMPDAKLRNIISECKRVLAPGGYLELMVLELDIVNMGSLTRRAVKDLKINMSIANREVSLKPITDNVQSILGSRGFSNVTKCMVGVPVVGRPVSSTGSSTSSRSSGGSIGTSSAGPKPFDGLAMQDGFSLNDLVADHSENADAKIGRVVSRTARSWWQHCFEASVISDGNLSKSVLANKEVLRECKTRASSFKLLIAYTQKPGLDQKRRTLSEPSMPALATAGGPRIPRSGKPTS